MAMKLKRTARGIEAIASTPARGAPESVAVAAGPLAPESSIDGQRIARARAPGPRYTGVSTRPGRVVFLPRTVFQFRPPSDRSQAVARGDVRVAITLECEDCKRRNYQTNKSKRNSPDRITLRKYCRWCRTHTSHKETR